MSQTPTATQILSAVQEGRMTAGEAVRALIALGFSDAQATTAIRDAGVGGRGGPEQTVIRQDPGFIPPAPPPPLAGGGAPVGVTPGLVSQAPGEGIQPSPFPIGPPGPGPGVGPGPAFGEGNVLPGPGQAPPGITPSPQQTLEQQQIIQSASRGGRGQLFDAILAQQGFSPLGQSLAQGAFNPLSASFALNQVLNPNIDPVSGDVSAANFANFLPQRFAQQLPTQGSFTDALNQIGGFFNNPNQTQQAGINAFLGPQNATDPQGTARNIISQTFLSGLNPLFRGSGQNIVNSILDAFLGSNPASNLFGSFLGGQLGGGQGVFQNRLG